MDFPSASAPYWILAATWASSTHLRALSPQARACFEGALPSLLYLPGIVPVVTLPGDTMFQSTIIQEHTQRPVILHAYAGAKVHMETMLQLLKHHGWISMAAAMVGTQKKPPAWTREDLRAVTGTSLDVRLLPTPLSPKEDLLLLARWHRRFLLPKRSAFATWLQAVNKELGPDGSCSPHPPIDAHTTDSLTSFESALHESGFWFVKDSTKTRGDRNVSLELGLLLTAYDVTEPNLAVLVAALLTGSTPSYFPEQRGLPLKEVLPLRSIMNKSGMKPLKCCRMPRTPLLLSSIARVTRFMTVMFRRMKTGYCFVWKLYLLTEIGAISFPRNALLRRLDLEVGIFPSLTGLMLWSVLIGMDRMCMDHL